MALVHVQCPQCQSIDVVQYGKQAHGLNAITATIPTVNAPFSSYSTMTKDVCQP